MKHLKNIELLFLFIMLLPGCAQTPLLIYPRQDVDNYPLIANKDGVKIAAKPVINKAELKHYLGTDIFSSGMLGIFVVMENSAGNISYLVSDDTFELGKKSEEKDTNRATADAGTAVTVGSFFTPLVLFPPVVIAGITMANNASRKNLNIERNHFPNGTLSPGERMQGFAYFKVPKDLSSELVFTVQLKNLDTLETMVSVFELRLNLATR